MNYLKKEIESLKENCKFAIAEKKVEYFLELFEAYNRENEKFSNNYYKLDSLLLDVLLSNKTEDKKIFNVLRLYKAINKDINLDLYKEIVNLIKL